MDVLLLADLAECDLDHSGALAKLRVEFEADLSDVERLLIAYVSVGSWGCDSSAWVLFLGKDGQLYEVHGSHCSCHGFEDQWEPTRTSGAYLLSDKFHFSTGGYDDDDSENRLKVADRIRLLFDADGTFRAA